MNSFADNFKDDLDDFGLPPSTGVAKAAPSGVVERCPKCRGTGVFTSYSGRPLGQCFHCKGKGELVYKNDAATRAQNRAKAAERKIRGEQARLEEFAAQNPVVWAWIEESRGTFGFAQSMYEAVAKHGDLTERQMEACQRGVLRRDTAREARQAAQQARLEAAPVVSMEKMLAAFGAAGRALKNPKLRMTGGLEISPAKATSANAGFLYVKAGDSYLGKISPEGKFLRGRDCSDADEGKLLAIAADPLAAAVAYGRETGSCSCCGRTLTNAVSIELGIGPVCREQWGWGG